MNKAFFLDKDGTLVDNSQFPEVMPSHYILTEDILDGLKYIQNLGYKLIIFSNQSGIAKGRLSVEEVEEIFKILISKLAKEGIIINDYIYCPHQKSDNCDCKKPKLKLIFESSKKHNLDLEKCFFVGDGKRDIMAGKNAGMKTILVLTGMGNHYKDIVDADYVLENLNEIMSIL